MPAFYDLMRKVIADPTVQVVPNNRNARPAGAPSRIDTDIYHAIEVANRKVYNVPTIPQMSTGATDMSFLRSKGMQCYGVGPASDMEDAAKGFGAHSDQERLLEDSLNKYFQFQWEFLSQVAFSHK
jgi:acetylornithine deacetylase/succinyl-diaminopimelate desuccinylase-like protein